MSRKRRAVFHSQGLTAFLAEQDKDSAENTFAEYLGDQDMKFSELSLISEQDLEKMGYHDKEKRKELLQYLAVLPNQSKTWEETINAEEAANYNQTIISNAAKHCLNLRNSLQAAHTKMNFDLPEDVVIENKRFASGFLVEALDGLLNATLTIEKNMDDLEKVMSKRNNPEKGKLKWFLFSMVIFPVVISAYLCYRKFK